MLIDNKMKTNEFKNVYSWLFARYQKTSLHLVDTKIFYHQLKYTNFDTYLLFASLSKETPKASFNGTKRLCFQFIISLVY